MRYMRLVVIYALLIIGSVAPASSAEERVALVIGNSAYSNVPLLPNPPRDAAAVAAVLREAGFNTVQVQKDLGYDNMRRALRDFSASAEKADWAVIYYAGHGIEVNGQNYLVPVDARLTSDRDVQFEAVPLDQVLASIEGARKLRLVILDACRDNPFLNQMRQTVASRSIGRGLAKVEPDGGTLVAFAAKHGQTALDGDGSSSPFTTSLVKNIAAPGVEINFLFRKVRDEVLTATARKQEPFIYGSLPGETFYFKPQMPNEVQTPLALSETTSTTAKQFAAVANPVSAPAVVPPASAVRAAAIDPIESEAQLALSPASIMQVQEKLTSLGFDPGATTGVLGPKLRNTLRSFQRSNLVEESGYLDSQTLAKLNQVIEDTPKTYDGLWHLEIHRYNFRRPDDELNLRTHLASAKLRLRNGEFFIVSSEMLSTKRNEFDSFQGRIEADGRLSVSMRLTYLFEKSKTGRMVIDSKLPKLVPFGGWIDIKGNSVEPEVWYKIKLQRVVS